LARFERYANTKDMIWMIKYMYCFGFLAFFAFFSVQVTAQKHADCAVAMEICKKNTIKVDKIKGIGRDEFEAEAVPCFLNSDKMGDAEMNSTWIKFEIKSGGSLAFTITPYDKTNDYDFVVYRLAKSGKCETKQIVRCNAAGDFNEFSECMGQTGLRTGETDSSEDSGCSNEGDNAWLAPLRTSSGEKYVILISNVTDSESGFSISFSGSAKLMCEDAAKEEPVVAAKPKPEPAKPKPAPPVLVVEPKAEAVAIADTEVIKPISAAPKQLGERAVDVKSDLVTVRSNKVRVTIWDNGIEDGDIVSVFVNEEKVLNQIALKKKPRIFDFTLPPNQKEFFFTVFSDSFGKIEPNTANVKIEDGVNNYTLKLVSTRNKQQSVKITVE
jgi:hypothetical protein